MHCVVAPIYLPGSVPGALLSYIISFHRPSPLLVCQQADLHRGAARGPGMKLMLESGEERQVLVWGMPGSDCSQALDLCEPTSRPGKWEHYPVSSWLEITG